MQDCLSGIVMVKWLAGNGSDYVTATMQTDTGISKMCMSDSNECSVPGLPCGQNFSVTITASNQQCNVTSSQSTTLQSGEVWKRNRCGLNNETQNNGEDAKVICLISKGHTNYDYNWSLGWTNATFIPEIILCMRLISNEGHFWPIMAFKSFDSCFLLSGSSLQCHVFPLMSQCLWTVTTTLLLCPGLPAVVLSSTRWQPPVVIATSAAWPMTSAVVLTTSHVAAVTRLRSWQWQTTAQVSQACLWCSTQVRHETPTVFDIDKHFLLLNYVLCLGPVKPRPQRKIRVRVKKN